jgi:hypothetical protein
VLIRITLVLTPLRSVCEPVGNLIKLFTSL